MEDETSNIEESVLNVTLEDNKVKKEQPKKGISVTRALVMLGFDDWKDLEPGMYKTELILLIIYHSVIFNIDKNCEYFHELHFCRSIIIV